MPVTAAHVYPAGFRTQKLHHRVMVFATSVQSAMDVKMLTPALNANFGKERWNFDLDDVDRILRIVSEEIEPAEAIRVLGQHGYDCRELED